MKPFTETNDQKPTTISYGKRSIVKKGGSLLISIPIEIAKEMGLGEEDEVDILFDEIDKQMIVTKSGHLVWPIVRTEEEEVRRILKNTGAFLERGHFKLASGKHSNSYIQVRVALTDHNVRDIFAKNIIKKFQDLSISAVASFTLGGVLLAVAIAKFLKIEKCIIGSKNYTKREVIFENIDAIGNSDRILIVDDVLTTGGSMNSAITVIKNMNKGDIVGIGVVVDRSKGEANLGYRTESLISIDIPKWDSQVECPLCKDNLLLFDLSEAEIDYRVSYPILGLKQRKDLDEGFTYYKRLLEAARRKEKLFDIVYPNRGE